MSHVYDVDPRLIERTAEWLAAQQQPDGSWKPDTQFINEGATNRYNSDVLRITAYLAWALEGNDSERTAIEKAGSYIASHLDRISSDKADAYTLAVLANFAVDGDKSSGLTHRILQMRSGADPRRTRATYRGTPSGHMPSEFYSPALVRTTRTLRRELQR